MQYENGFEVKVGDIAIKNDGVVVLVVAVNDIYFWGLHSSGKDISVYHQSELYRFKLCDNIDFKVTLAKLDLLEFKDTFESKSKKLRNILLSQLIGQWVVDEDNKKFFVTGFYYGSVGLMLFVEGEDGARGSIDPDNVSVNNGNVYRYLYKVEKELLNNGLDVE